MIDVVVKGPGELTIGAVDRKGRLLLRKRIVASGDPGIEARTQLPLTVQTRNGAVPVVPLLIQRKDARQHITFAGRDAPDFTAERCREMKVSTAMIDKASRTAAAALEHNEWPHLLIRPSATRGQRGR
jgi:hypothetical protein